MKELKQKLQQFKRTLALSSTDDQLKKRLSELTDLFGELLDSFKTVEIANGGQDTPNSDVPTNKPKPTGQNKVPPSPTNAT